jgi:hypothetical protein
MLVRVPFSSVDPSIPAEIPAAVAEAVPDSTLDEAGRAGVAELAEAFAAKVTGGSQDPRDPSHQRRWVEAQTESDALMRMRYGGHAWLRHHIEVHRQALDDSARLPGLEE